MVRPREWGERMQNGQAILVAGAKQGISTWENEEVHFKPLPS